MTSSWPVAAALVAAALATGVPSHAQPVACADCHEVDSDPILQTPHGFLDCGDCHAGFDEELHPEEMAAPACADCHDDAVAGLAAGAHGEEARAGGPLEPLACADCHGAVHTLVPADAPASPIHPRRLAETCGSCHADPDLAAERGFRMVQPLAAYLSSVHARALAQGREGATCADCHGSHEILPAEDPGSTVHRSRVPGSCGACHSEIAVTFAESVHGQAAAHGIRDSPVCTDCHGEHRILSPVEEGSPVFATNLPRMTCGRCHGDLRMSEKYGLDPSTVPAFLDSYHGLATRAGTMTVANCASCHGIHDILPSSDPESHVHPDNLAATCGTCHPGAGSRFAIGPVHVLPTEREHAAVYWARRIYLWLIVLTVGAMLLHNGADLYRKARRPLPPPPRTAPRRERLSLPFRIGHGLLAGSFVVLAYTGFALKYPEAWWAAPLLQWEDSFGLRGWIHRAAAVVMLAAALWHVGHLAVSRRARHCIAGMRPGRRDWIELKERVAWFLGRAEHPPRSPWIGYPEKIEYFAVIWGTVLMAVTGFLLWFENLALAALPKWATDLATVVHFYEAVLATLAILVWHFYLVIFDPLVYPMDPAWITGRSAPARDAERESESES